jgi:hypothetical protein
MAASNEDKLYLISEPNIVALTELINSSYLNGVRVMYYEIFYNKNYDIMQNLEISSPLHLKSVISKLFNNWIIHKTYCLAEKHITIETEIMRCFNDNESVTLSYLTNKLPYIPSKEIERVIFKSRHVYQVSTNKYIHIKEVKFDEKECHHICSLVEHTIDNNGFISLSSFSVTANEELNPEFTGKSLKIIIISHYLPDKYAIDGNIVYLKGGKFNAHNFIKDYCLARKTIAFEELHQLELEFSENCHNHALEIADNYMVRINFALFVADSEIQFDIDATDRAISLFMRKDVIPLQEVSSFVSFPFLKNHTWNWFLLESFCRRFSKLFSYECLAINSCNVGAIYKKSAGFESYHHVLAQAVLDDDITLDIATVGDFLFENKYIAQRTKSISKIIELARA